jgi:hypothetical protein
MVYPAVAPTCDCNYVSEIDVAMENREQALWEP